MKKIRLHRRLPKAQTSDFDICHQSHYFLKSPQDKINRREARSLDCLGPARNLHSQLNNGIKLPHAAFDLESNRQKHFGICSTSSKWPSLSNLFSRICCIVRACTDHPWVSSIWFLRRERLIKTLRKQTSPKCWFLADMAARWIKHWVLPGDRPGLCVVYNTLWFAMNIQLP